MPEPQEPLHVVDDGQDALAPRAILPLWAMVATMVTTIGLVLFTLLFFAADAVDRISIARENSLVELVTTQSVEEVSHNQESVTVWDDAIFQLRRDKLDNEWLDNNLGIWLHSYFGLDESYVLDAKGAAVYAMRDGRRVDPATFQRLRRGVAPLVARLRQKQLAVPAEPLPETELSPGVTEVVTLAGRPAIVSVKPIVSDSGNIEQAVGTESVHLAVRRLDGTFVDKLGRDYLFSGVRFSWRANLSAGEAAFPWRSSAGKTVGYLIWKPFRPGSQFLEKTIPWLLGGFVLIALVTALLVRKVHIGTRQLKTSQVRAQHLAFHDALTGLPNRALFDERLQRALTLFQRDPARQVALLYLDLDRFKRVNDSLGHPAGDQLIRELGGRMRGLIRTSDTIARLGGDEFAIIQTDVRSPQETEALCERLIAAAKEPFILSGQQAFVGISVGVAFAGSDGCDARELARKSDIALYESKNRGRSCYTIFRDELDEPIQRRETIERDLRAALETDTQLSVHYQPQFSSRTGDISGVEALVRWDHPVRGAISPATFVPTAEDAGLIHQLGNQVLREACAAASGWDIPLLCVNVSPIQLCNPHFGLRVFEILEETGLPPQRLELEITETALIANARECEPNIRLLRHGGVSIALDDFGTGYSSLRHLSDFEVDRVKIDRSFVHEIRGAASGDALVQAIVDLAQAVGIKTTAEGVETVEQSAFLRQIGCDDLQGFLLAPPMSAQELEELLNSGPGRPRSRSSDLPVDAMDEPMPPKSKRMRRC
ncbi:MAG: EAL domain-containing protein [Sphingomicrobium sp.]